MQANTPSIGMDDINSAYSEVKNYLSLVDAMSEVEEGIRKNAAAISKFSSKRESLEKRLSELDPDSLRERVEEIRLGMKVINLSTSELNSWKDIDERRKLGVPREVLLGKIVKLVENKVAVHTLSIKEYNDFRLKCDEDRRCLSKDEVIVDRIDFNNDIDGVVAMILVDKDIEKVLEDFPSIRSLDTLVSPIVREICFYVMEFYESERNAIICFSTKRTERICGCDHHEFDVVHVDPTCFFERFGKISLSVCSLIKNELRLRVETGMFNREFLFRLLSRFNETPLSVKSLDDWTLDALVGSVMRSRGSIDTLINIYRKMKEVNSRRKEKALNVAKKAIKRRFDKILESMSIYGLLSISKRLRETLSDIYEEIDAAELENSIIAKVAEKSAVGEKIFKMKECEAIVEIKSTVYDLVECANDKLCDDQSREVLTSAFFEKSYENFINFIMSHEPMSSGESATLARIGSYLMSQCLLPPKSVANYFRMSTLTRMLEGSSIHHGSHMDLAEAFGQKELDALSRVIPWNKEIHT